MNMQPRDNPEMTADDYVNMLHKQLAEANKKLVAAEARIEKQNTALVYAGNVLVVSSHAAAKMVYEALETVDDLSALREHDTQLLENFVNFIKSKSITQGNWVYHATKSMAAEIRAQHQRV